jgi:beta-lactamase regulating signal transducer with metallopeptidase domain
VDIIAPVQIAPPDVINWGIIIITVWLCMAVLWLGYQLVQQARFKSHLIAQSAEPDPTLSAEIKRAAANVGLRKVPRVRVASDAAGPLVTGVYTPVVILPNDFSETFEVEQRHFALVHEFAHIKRRDLWVALITLVFRALNWPNPLVHYASHKLRGDQEAACDAFVVKVTGGETAHSYAETLVKAVRQDGATSRKNAHLALSLTQSVTENSEGD